MYQKLLTKEIKTALKRNAQKVKDGTSDGKDIKPVLKLFTPWGSATWLFTELDDDDDTLFGLCDLGMGFPEVGYASLDELTSLRGPWGLKIERDMHWTADKTLGEYADQAITHQRIVA